MPEHRLSRLARRCSMGNRTADIHLLKRLVFRTHNKYSQCCSGWRNISAYHLSQTLGKTSPSKETMANSINLEEISRVAISFQLMWTEDQIRILPSTILLCN